MARDRALSVLFALVLAALGLWIALRATEPPGARGLAPGELQATEARERETRDAAISRCLEKERRLKTALRSGDFDGCMQIAHTRRLMLTLKAVREGIDKSEIPSDPELQRILRQCRRWAKSDDQQTLVDSLSRAPH